jgi:flagellar biosynthesis chaperone FliJ
MTRQAGRAKRLRRIERIGDAVARASEAAWLQRRNELQEQKDRLSTVAGYCGDYARRTTDLEARGTDIMSLRLYRDFSGWLSQVQNDQSNAVAQAEFLADAAAEEAAVKRTFARSLEQAATRAATLATQERARAEQKQLDALARPMRSDAQQG